jgi:hypothetical protein
VLTRALNSETVIEQNGGEPVNIRFVEMANQRSARRYWVKDLASRKDYAAIFFLADCRDHPTLLLTARTLNWFMRTCQKTYEIKVIALYSARAQLDEFKGYVPDDADLQPFCETEPDTIVEYAKTLQAIEKRFNEQRRNQTMTVTKTVM